MPRRRSQQLDAACLERLALVIPSLRARKTNYRQLAYDEGFMHLLEESADSVLVSQRGLIKYCTFLEKHWGDDLPQLPLSRNLRFRLLHEAGWPIQYGQVGGLKLMMSPVALWSAYRLIYEHPDHFQYMICQNKKWLTKDELHIMREMVDA